MQFEGCGCLTDLKFVYPVSDDPFEAIMALPRIDDSPPTSDNGTGAAPANGSNSSGSESGTGTGGAGESGGPLRCNGLSSNTWVTADTARDAIKQFCASSLTLDGLPFDTDGSRYILHDYNNKTERALTLKWTFLDSTFYEDLTISPEDCSAAFLNLVNNCDINYGQNPGGLKHGGTYDFTVATGGQAVLELNPTTTGQNQLECNAVNEQASASADQLNAHLLQFCNEILSTSTADHPLRTFDQGTTDEVTVEADFNHGKRADDITCGFVFTGLVDLCPGGDQKYGGSYVIEDIGAFTMTPAKN